MTIHLNTPLPILGGLSPRAFLRDYWQQKPLLIRQAIPDFESPVDGNDLAGLSLEEEIESRLILEHGEHPWECRTGPFDAHQFEQLPASHWTLLVQSVDVWLPEVADLRKQFRFLPDWRVEDIMVSYASRQGGVGPHYDQYDVFLLQGAGTRRWRLGRHCRGDEPKVPEAALGILQNPSPIFEEGEEWVLEPGDMLYVPPGVAHWGTAETDDCITYSVGFRAPSQREILSGCSESASDHLHDHLRFKDVFSEQRTNAGQILQQDITQLKALLRDAIDQLCQDDTALAQWFGKEMTYPRVEDSLLEIEGHDAMTEDTLNPFLLDNDLQRSSNARFAYFSGTQSLSNCQRSTDQHGDGIASDAILFVNGDAYRCSNLLAQHLCSTYHYDAGSLSQFAHKTDDQTMLLHLISQGWLETARD